MYELKVKLNFQTSDTLKPGYLPWEVYGYFMGQHIDKRGHMTRWGKKPAVIYNNNFAVHNLTGINIFRWVEEGLNKVGGLEVLGISYLDHMCKWWSLNELESEASWQHTKKEQCRGYGILFAITYGLVIPLTFLKHIWKHIFLKILLTNIFFNFSWHILTYLFYISFCFNF